MSFLRQANALQPLELFHSWNHSHSSNGSHPDFGCSTGCVYFTDCGYPADCGCSTGCVYSTPSAPEADSLAPPSATTNASNSATHVAPIGVGGIVGALIGFLNDTIPGHLSIYP